MLVTLRTWHAAYPRIGVPEAIGMVADLADGSFAVAVAATGRTDDPRVFGPPLSRVRGQLGEAQALADAAAARILGRCVVGRWRGPTDDEATSGSSLTRNSPDSAT